MHLGYSFVVINRYYAPNHRERGARLMHTGAQEQMQAADVFSLSTASINVLLPSAIRETQSDQ